MDDCTQYPHLLCLTARAKESGSPAWGGWNCPAFCHPQSNWSWVHQQWLYSMPLPLNNCGGRGIVTTKEVVPDLLLRNYYIHTHLRWEMIISIALMSKGVFSLCLAKNLPLLRFTGMTEFSSATEAATEVQQHPYYSFCLFWQNWLYVAPRQKKTVPHWCMVVW